MEQRTDTPGSIPLERPEPIVRVDQIGWVLFDKPDLGATQRFLEDFGLTRVESGGDAHLYRGAGGLPYLYVARPAARAGFIGTGFLVKHRDDLDRLAETSGSPVEALERPGGGHCVRLRDPDGHLVEVAHGVEPVAPLPTRTAPLPVNTPFEKRRVGTPQRPPLEPAAVVRLGHCVVGSTRFADTATWYMRHLGLIPTDVQCLGDGRPALAFMRPDRGKEPADHHAFVVGFGLRDEFLHCAFEVLDLDALGQGQQVLRRGGWKHAWGIGRHLLGSQLFDYWRDGDGFEHEHYTDGDVFDDTHPTAYSRLEMGGLWQWGVDLPKDFGPRPSPAMLGALVRGLVSRRIDFHTLKQLAALARTPARPWLR